MGGCLYAPCPTCGARDIELRSKSSPILCYYVHCCNCGRETAKHRKEEDANREWNLSPDRFVREDHHEPES